MFCTSSSLSMSLARLGFQICLCLDCTLEPELTLTVHKTGRSDSPLINNYNTYLEIPPCCLHPADPTLTTDNIMEVVKETEQWENLGHELGVLYSKMENVKSLYRSDCQRMEATLDHYVRSPTASWKRVARVLQVMKLHKQADEVTTEYVKGMNANCHTFGSESSS